MKVFCLKILTIIGARPQFIKAAPVSFALLGHHEEIIVHTGQHYDENMSEIFFRELNIPKPHYNLAIGSGSHGRQTGMMLIKIEEVIEKEKPDAVMVYGDTNSTLAGALAASKLLIPVIHIEAGLRSFNMSMPEEQNRILTDHISCRLLCPTKTAVANLKNEGITKGVFNIGDVMYDAVLNSKSLALQHNTINKMLNLEGEYMLATIHRAENTNDPDRLRDIVEAFNKSGRIIILPLHPRTQKYIADYGLKFESNVKVIEPVGYFDMIYLEMNSQKILTDSGGIQKEAYMLGVPCITLRDETEWVETVDDGWNMLAGAQKEKILDGIMNFYPSSKRHDLFGDGKASLKVLGILNNMGN